MGPCRRVGLVIALGVALAFGGLGEEIDEYQVKAVFLCNFAKFVEWPAQTFKTADDPIVICVIGRNPFGKALETAASRSRAQGRKITVAEIAEVRPGCMCQILFVATIERKPLRSLLERIGESGILTVGESEGFTANGGVVNFKLVDSQVRFEINPDAARRENLRISSKLLTLAEIRK
jgi:hypothetical protein